VKRFNLKKREMDVRKHHQSKIQERFECLEKLNHSEYINGAWENIKENVKISAKKSSCLYELKQLKPRFDEERLRFLDQRKQAKMQWLNDSNQRNVDNINKRKK